MLASLYCSIRLWSGWAAIFLRNFPHYEISHIGQATIIIFHRTGHTLSLSDPYGIPQKHIQLVRQAWIQQSLLYKFLH